MEFFWCWIVEILKFLIVSHLELRNISFFTCKSNGNTFLISFIYVCVCACTRECSIYCYFTFVKPYQQSCHYFLSINKQNNFLSILVFKGFHGFHLSFHNTPDSLSPLFSTSMLALNGFSKKKKKCKLFNGSDSPSLPFLHLPLLIEPNQFIPILLPPPL